LSWESRNSRISVLFATGSTVKDPLLTEEELIYILEVQIPDLLDRRPELQWRIYSAFLNLFARREEIAAI
jgi:hypothetical protein